MLQITSLPCRSLVVVRKAAALCNRTRCHTKLIFAFTERVRSHFLLGVRGLSHERYN